MSRIAEIERNTEETKIFFKLNLDGAGEAIVDTGIPFMDHMFTLFAKHGFFDLEIKVDGDIEVDYHHTIEDLGLVFGSVLKKALGDKKGIKRYGSFILPMDETLVMIALDFSGRPYLVYDVEPPADYLKDIDTRLFYEFFQAFTVKCEINLHINMKRSEEIHHLIEAIFKCLAKAIDQAIAPEPRLDGKVMSTKGIL